MKIKWFRSILSIILVLFLFLLLGIITINYNFSNTAHAAQSNFLSSDISVKEHRISFVQEDDLNTVTVIDEFWITNQGTEPHFEYVFNALPEDIHTHTGMICKISETGGHSCYPWLHENNNYYWESAYVILPNNYATEFNLEINVYSIENQSINTSITKELGSESENVEEMIEVDDWGWIREGFYRGWKVLFDFNISNENNETEPFELKNAKIPEGIILEIYTDSNNDSIFDANDTLLGFDSDLDGVWDSVQGFDSNQNNLPEIAIDPKTNKTFFVFLRADYNLHFYSKFQKVIEPSSDGTLTYSKKTLYDTSLMRVFVVPKKDIETDNGDISFTKMDSGSSTFYYGEWEGSENSEFNINLMGEAPGQKTSVQDNPNLMITFLFVFIVVIILIGVMAFRRKQERAKLERNKNIEKSHTRSEKSRTIRESQDMAPEASKQKVSRNEYQRLLKKRKKLRNMLDRIKAKEFEDETEKEIELELASELEVKLKKVEMELKKKKVLLNKQKTRNTKALKRLEEDYKAGSLDKEIYDELKNKYMGN